MKFATGDRVVHTVTGQEMRVVRVLDEAVICGRMGGTKYEKLPSGLTLLVPTDDWTETAYEPRVLQKVEARS